MSRNVAIDIFRIVAAFFVICIHAPFITWGTNPIYKCAVPFFCLVTGYYLNGKKEDDKLFFNKILVYLRILLLAVIVYLILALFEGVDVEIPSLKILALYNSFGFINAPHLWYLLALIISLSIIHLLKKCGVVWMIYMFLPFIIISPLGKYNLLPFSRLIENYDANWLLTTLPYIACGFTIRTLDGGKEKLKYLYLAIALFFVILTLFESKYWGGMLSDKSAFYVGTPFYSIGLFLFLLSVRIPSSPLLIAFADFCKKASLPIYVWHFLIINILKVCALYELLQPFVALYVFIFLVFIIVSVSLVRRLCRGMIYQ